ncbi:hypothetical protein F4813DRAFT_394371 [Daldinia decipiens]|uniref:uncharacterized protein n=1 Tax=Daldinia decipiens TaxID=326647 RepID=UPI0020C1C287|nr:uncharacterized protein F4813DRAFT_394371 [Daldinia decipiens]KAI1652729.1 hypothetical protein F4813DRAFT_394371 [Daldinia decipiens]
MKRFDKSWIGLVLVDSTSSEIIGNPDSQFRLRREPLHNSGFEDFHAPQSFSTFQQAGT